jgi:hypothetical protein
MLGGLVEHTGLIRIGHLHHPLTQSVLLDLFVFLTRLIPRLLYLILFIMCPRYPAILGHRSVVVLRGAYETHML